MEMFSHVHADAFWNIMHDNMNSLAIIKIS